MTEPQSSAASSRKRRRAQTVDAAPAQPLGGTWCVGTVTEAEHGALVVQSGGLRLAATRAASCLLAPAAGDSVACLRVAPNETWVLAVLQREEGVPQVLHCEGDTRLEVAHGTLALKAPRIELRTDTLDASARHTTLATDSADLVGRQLSLVASRIKLVGSMLSSVVDRVQHFSKNYLRHTDGMDKVSAMHVEVQAEQLMRLEGEHALVNGRELIKARGAQIHFG
ncbi:DUF3540 domain-containing protein [Variovorax sp. KK3]|uniref:DUF3540 domain-containing protein n=1 Tax=Variovorax sp. KK3 TaxID=1855728 RepID=UPI00097BECFB|nr:DUF3540 domain-containing protein [Variovorax sp. KK3]